MGGWGRGAGGRRGGDWPAPALGGNRAPPMDYRFPSAPLRAPSPQAPGSQQQRPPPPQPSASLGPQKSPCIASKPPPPPTKAL